MDYDPHSHRAIANLSYFDAMVSMLKCVFGSGMLTMPVAFKNVGWCLGFIGMAVICSILTYSIHILIRGMTEIARRHQVPYMPFAEAMYKGFLEGPTCLYAFPVLPKIFVLFFMLVFYACVGAAYMIFLADNINKMLGIYSSPVDKRILLCLLIPAMFAIYMVRSLKALVPFSFTANICLFTSLFAIVYVIVQDLPPLKERVAFNDIKGIPIFFGIALFACCSIGVFLSIESQMIKPQQYISGFGVLNVSMVFNYCIISLFSFLGYWKYGDDIKGSITLNVGEQSILGQVIIVLYCIAIYISYSLQCSVIIDLVWVNGISDKFEPERQFMYEIILRFFIVIITATIAIALPRFDLVTGLAGCISLTILAIAFPGVLDMCLRYEEGNYGRFKIVLLRDSLLILFGVGFCVLGIYSAFYY